MTLQAKYAEFTGADEWHRVAFTKGTGIFTSGVKAMAEAEKAYWLIDAIFSYLPKLEKSGDYFFPIRLTRVKDNNFLLTIGDDDNPFVIKQEIEHSDFPGDFKLYLAQSHHDEEGLYTWTLMLPSEY